MAGSWMAEFEDYLKDSIDQIDCLEGGRVREAMGYMLLAGGKRLRPRLFFSILADYGKDPRDYFNIGAALEMIHCYSLIHDDLPCMDDDTWRRGKLTCHKAFDEATALLAGDGLLTQAFAQSVKPGALKAEQQIQIVSILSRYAGAGSLILGQELDLGFESGLYDLKEMDQSEQLRLITQMYDLKTGSLFSACIQLALICLDFPAQSMERTAWLGIAYWLGILFQLQDDLLEYEQSEQQLGKSLSDIVHGKKTIPALIGLEQAKALVKEQKEILLDQLALLEKELPYCQALIDFILNREK